MDLRSVLNKLGANINRRYPDINSGGCCVFASLVGHELERRNIDTKIIVASTCPEDKGHKASIDDARLFVGRDNCMSRWNDEGIQFSHVGIEFRLGDDVYHYDSNGAHPEDALLGIYRIYPGRLTVKEATELANDGDGWNSMFDRDDIPGLRMRIQKFFNTNLPLTAGS